MKTAKTQTTQLVSYKPWKKTVGHAYLQIAISNGHSQWIATAWETSKETFGKPAIQLQHKSKRRGKAGIATNSILQLPLQQC